MFYYLDGTITIMDTNLAVVDCGGVGYGCRTTNYTLSQLKLGKPARLFTYCNIREDAFDIYGFASREELNCFEQLLSVSGVGPKAALSILSVVTPDQFMLAVMTQDAKTLTMAQGVGKKMAQRILLELKDKVADSTLELQGVSVSDMPVVRGSKTAEATAALSALGYSQAEIGAALKGVDAEKLSVEVIVRQALRNMVMK